jgi:hypothetical protein
MQIPFERSSEKFGEQAELELGEFFESWSSSADDKDPRLALIVRIAQKVASVVRELVAHPRRILRRDRNLQRIDKVRQIDPAGIRWLARQQGHSLAERAGPRQKLLAVVRQESIDTLENRVLADFLHRCADEASIWTREHQKQSDHQRFRQVSGFQRLCQQASGSEPFSLLARPTGVPAPNYVLLQDERYNQIWSWYLKLVRRQQVYDSMWAWSQRTFAEGVALSIAWAVDLIQSDALGDQWPAPWSRSLAVLDEHRGGRLTDDSGLFIGWVRDPAGNSVISLAARHQLPSLLSRFPHLAALVEVLPDLLILEHAARGSFQPRLVAAVWTRLGPIDPALSRGDRERIGQALCQSFPGQDGEAWLLDGTAGCQGSQEAERHAERVSGRSTAILRVECSLHVDRLRHWVQARLTERLEELDRER